MGKIEVQITEDTLIIGKAPQLVVDLKNQDNYIEMDGRKIPYRRKIEFSPDLLAGKRKNVFETAVGYYYGHACEVAEGVKIAEQYRARANRTIREIK